MAKMGVSFYLDQTLIDGLGDKRSERLTEILNEFLADPLPLESFFPRRRAIRGSFSFALPADTIVKLDAYARSLGIPRSWVVEKAIETGGKK